MESTPSPAGQLTAVSCISPSTCEAAGWLSNAAGDNFTLAEGRSG
jgi:hypothetical protein